MWAEVLHPVINPVNMRNLQEDRPMLDDIEFSNVH